jgi:tetratricopeptide (TPR) repeat protein
MLRRHRPIWYLTAAVCALAAVVAHVRESHSPTRYVPRLSEAEQEAAIADMMAALEEDPRARLPHTRALVDQASALAASGQLTNAETWYALGLAEQEAGNLAEAEKALREAVAARPDWSWPHNALANVLYARGRVGEAVGKLQKAMRLDPQWSRPHNDLAFIYRHEGRLAEAEEAARRAIELDPDNVATHNNFGNLMVIQGRYDEAEKAYRRAVDCAPSHPAPHYNLACLASLRGNEEAVFEPLTRAIELNDAFRQAAAQDPDFAPLRDHPRFRELVE